jgi:phosphate transport system substrate-binding protein
MINQAGKRVEPTMATFQAAAANADFRKAADFYLILTEQPGDKTWPITAATYMLLRKDAPAGQNAAMLKFLDWCLKEGQALAKALDYVPLPANVVKQIEQSWADQLRGPDGKPLWTVASIP